MVVFHCVGCRAVYAEARAPRRCARCHGKAFAAVDDDSPTAALVDAGPSLGTPPENLDAELAAAFARSEHFRLTGRDEPPPSQSVKEGLLDAVERMKGAGAVPPIVGPLVAGLLGEMGPLQKHVYEETQKIVLEGDDDDDAPATPRDMPPQD